jgi:flagellar assembly protein FliH
MAPTRSWSIERAPRPDRGRIARIAAERRNGLARGTAMTARAKFLFDADFGRAKEVVPRISPEEHEAAVGAAELRGYQRGIATAEAQAKSEAERRTAAAYERIAGMLMASTRDLSAIEARLETEAVEVAVAAAGRLAGALVAREPLAEIAALATDCFNAFVAAPHVVVRVNNDLYPAVRDRLAELARARGFEGRLVVLGETDIALGDCRIEWADGGAIRDRGAIEKTIDDLVARYMASRQSAEAKGIDHGRQ